MNTSIGALYLQLLSVHLDENNGNSVDDSYSGTGIYNYETLTFPTCTNADDDGLFAKPVRDVVFEDSGTA